MKKYLILLVSLFLVALVYTSCNKDNLRKKENTLQLNKQEVLLQVGASYQLTVSQKDGSDPGQIAWKSSNENIATVSLVGLVKAISEGDVTITASSATGFATCKIKVVPNDNKGLEGMKFDKDSYELLPREKQVLKLLFTPARWSGPVTYTSSNESVVSVSNEGEIMGIQEGEASITATVGSITATCSVIVNSPVSYNVKIIPNIITLSKGKSTKPELLVNGEPYELRFPLIWRSSDEECFSIDETGTITGKIFGAGVVTVAIDNGHPDNTAYAYVKVEDLSLPNEYDANFVCNSVPFPYLEFPTTRERIDAAERNIGNDPIPFRKFIREEDGRLYYRLRDFAGYNPAGVFFGMVVYNPNPANGKPFALAQAEGITNEDRILIMQQFIEKAGFGTLKKIQITDDLYAYRAVNEATSQSILIYLAPNPEENYQTKMGILEFRTLENDPYVNNSAVD